MLTAISTRLWAAIHQPQYHHHLSRWPYLRPSADATGHVGGGVAVGNKEPGESRLGHAQGGHRGAEVGGGHWLSPVSIAASAAALLPRAAAAVGTLHAENSFRAAQ